MKQFRSVLIAGLLVALPILSFAATRKSINISEPVAVGSTVLQPGDYKVQWDGAGPTVQVTFLQGKKTVATSAATVKTGATGYDSALDLSNQAGGAKQLRAIEFKDMALEFDQSAAPSGQ
jgi:hypothetical protein